MKNSFPRLKLYFFVLKMMYILSEINVYILYTYIHFHVVSTPESVVMIASVGMLRVNLGYNIVMYDIDS